jgi:hypothetical protein
LGRRVQVDANDKNNWAKSQSCLREGERVGGWERWLKERESRRETGRWPRGGSGQAALFKKTRSINE